MGLTLACASILAKASMGRPAYAKAPVGRPFGRRWDNEEKKRVECKKHGEGKLKNRAKASNNQPVGNQILVLIIAASFRSPMNDFTLYFGLGKDHILDYVNGYDHI